MSSEIFQLAFGKSSENVHRCLYHLLLLCQNSNFPLEIYFKTIVMSINVYYGYFQISTRWVEIEKNHYLIDRIMP